MKDFGNDHVLIISTMDRLTGTDARRYAGFGTKSKKQLATIILRACVLLFLIHLCSPSNRLESHFKLRKRLIASASDA